MKNVVIIMTCFNRKEKTVSCIKSLSKAMDEEVTFRFIVVDDRSTDGTIQALEELNCNVDIVTGTGNLFYTGGMYRGIAYAKQQYAAADYYMLVNDDVEFDADKIQKMILSATPDEVLIGSTCDSNGEFSYGGTLYYKRIKYRSIGPEEPTVACTTFNGNCALIAHDIFFAVGNIDSYYKHGMGDFDYGFQVSRLGYQIYVFNEFIGVCNSNPVAGTWNDRSLSRRERLRLKESFKGLPYKDWFHYLKKNFGLRMAIIRSLTPYVKIMMGK